MSDWKWWKANEGASSSLLITTPQDPGQIPRWQCDHGYRNPEMINGWFKRVLVPAGGSSQLLSSLEQRDAMICKTLFASTVNSPSRHHGHEHPLHMCKQLSSTSKDSVSTLSIFALCATRTTRCSSSRFSRQPPLRLFGRFARSCSMHVVASATCGVLRRTRQHCKTTSWKFHGPTEQLSNSVFGEEVRVRRRVRGRMAMDLQQLNFARYRERRGFCLSMESDLCRWKCLLWV